MRSMKCDSCGGRLDRPGLFLCEIFEHPEPTLAQRIVLAIERNLSDRRGIGWGELDDDIAAELRDNLAEIVEAELRAAARD